MKHLFLLAVCCAFFVAAKAQSPFMDIHNNRPVDVYMELFGDNGCGTAASTGVIMIPANTHWNGTPTSAFSWSPFTPADFVAVVIYEGNPTTCPGVSFINIGSPCVGLPNVANINYMDNACNVVGVNAPMNWDSPFGSPGHLGIHP